MRARWRRGAGKIKKCHTLFFILLMPTTNDRHLLLQISIKTSAAGGDFAQARGDGLNRLPGYCSTASAPS